MSELAFAAASRPRQYCVLILYEVQGTGGIAENIFELVRTCSLDIFRHNASVMTSINCIFRARDSLSTTALYSGCSKLQ